LASIRIPPTIPPLLVFTLKMYLFNLIAPNEIDVELSTRPTNKELELWDFSFLL
jgi:hypothetical protein